MRQLRPSPAAASKEPEGLIQIEEMERTES